MHQGSTWRPHELSESTLLLIRHVAKEREIALTKSRFALDDHPCWPSTIADWSSRSTQQVRLQSSDACFWVLPVLPRHSCTKEARFMTLATSPAVHKVFETTFAEPLAREKGTSFLHGSDFLCSIVSYSYSHQQVSSMLSPFVRNVATMCAKQLHKVICSESKWWSQLRQASSQGRIPFTK